LIVILSIPVRGPLSSVTCLHVLHLPSPHFGRKFPQPHY